MGIREEDEFERDLNSDLYDDDLEPTTGGWVRGLGRDQICPEARLKSIHDTPSFDTAEDWRGK